MHPAVLLHAGRKDGGGFSDGAKDAPKKKLGRYAARCPKSISGVAETV